MGIEDIVDVGRDCKCIGFIRGAYIEEAGRRIRDDQVVVVRRRGDLGDKRSGVVAVELILTVQSNFSSERSRKLVVGTQVDIPWRVYLGQLDNFVTRDHKWHAWCDEVIAAEVRVYESNRQCGTQALRQQSLRLNIKAVEHGVVGVRGEGRSACRDYDLLNVVPHHVEGARVNLQTMIEERILRSNFVAPVIIRFIWWRRKTTEISNRRIAATYAKTLGNCRVSHVVAVKLIGKSNARSIRCF